MVQICQSLDQAVSGIPHGSSIMFSGFAGPGTPRNLIAALIRQGATALTGISNTPGRPDSFLDLDNLISAGRVKKMITAFTSVPRPSQVIAFDQLFEQGLIEGELVPQGTLAERIRAGGSGIGAFYVRTGIGTEMSDGKEDRVINGLHYLLEYPLVADFAFVRAYRADTLGNLQYRLTQRNFGPLMAQAAKCTIVEVEEAIASPGAIDPDSVHTPGICVDRIVQIPGLPEGIWD
jgi:3-oxoadipate CoA-transferase alpha subunit